MRQVLVMKRAEWAIAEVAQFISSKNNPETGSKFIDEVIDFCLGYARLSIHYPPCKNKLLAARKYHCLVFKKKWIVVFKVTEEQFKVYRFIYGARLK